MVDLKKEKEPIGEGRVTVSPEFPTVESPRKPEGENLEVESLMEKIERRFARVPKGQPGPQDDQVIVQQPMSKQPPIQLPVNQQQMVTARKAKTDLSIAWLVQWAIRQIKMMARLGRKVELRDIPETKKDGT